MSFSGLYLEGGISISEENISPLVKHLQEVYDEICTLEIAGNTDYDRGCIKYIIEAGINGIGTDREKIIAIFEEAGWATQGTDNGKGAIMGMTPNCSTCWYNYHEDFWSECAPYMMDCEVIWNGEDAETRRWRFIGGKFELDLCTRYIWNDDDPAVKARGPVHRAIETLLLFKEKGVPKGFFDKGQPGDNLLDELAHLQKEVLP